jgi:chromosome transmission fidelity protein 1
MGGKMSEGINFTDALARCVVVVGMPFADRRDPILQEKLKHADSLSANSGNALYEAMCMKTVNQTIGRSIRHANDYAAILLFDKRYAQRTVIKQLPGWISASLSTFQTFSQAKEELDRFFQSKNT